jgi:hypothetical protein
MLETTMIDNNITASVRFESMTVYNIIKNRNSNINTILLLFPLVQKSESESY